MALVDYGSSGDSTDDENEMLETQEITEHKTVTNCVVNLQQTHSYTSESNIFSSLPKPKHQLLLGGNEDNLKNLLLSKSDSSNKKNHVKISVPSLSQFENDDTPKPSSKKLKQSGKGIGLFSVLPPPKNMTPNENNLKLIPHALTNKISKQKTEQLLKAYTSKPQNKNLTNLNKISADDDDHSDSGTTSYFGEGISSSFQNSFINNPSDNSNIPLHVENGVINCSSHFINNETTVKYMQSFDNSDTSDQQMVFNTLPASSDTLELDDKALQILCGGKRKRNQMPVNIIDLSGEEIMPDSKEWLLKQFTEEKQGRSHSHRKNNGPSVQSRRKHQITYLAYQAKAQELELQNQWSNNRMSRRQTQSKYGF